MAAPADVIREAARAIPVRNAWYLLLYAWDMAEWRQKHSAAVEASPHLLGLLGSMLAASTRDLLRRQLARAHSARSAVIRGIRGRVNFDQSMKRLLFHHGAAHCTFPELNLDSLKNRIIRATLYKLAGEPRLRHVEREKELELRAELRSLMGAMGDVPLGEITRSHFYRLQLSRNDRDYAFPLSICRLVATLDMPGEAGGDHALVALLRDEITFHELFERFVRNFYRLHLRSSRVGSEPLSWHDELSNPLAPGMHTDVTITETAAPYRRTVIDTKYSISTLARTQFGGKRFKSDNLYQLYTYLRTQEHLGPSHRDARGILLYPMTEDEVDSDIRVQGHTIRVATLNLADEWQKIERRLLELVASTSTH